MTTIKAASCREHLCDGSGSEGKKPWMMKLHCFSNTLVAQSPLIIHDYKQFAPVVFFLEPSKRIFVP